MSSGITVASRQGISASDDQIAPPEFDPVDAKLARRDVEQPLAKEIRLEAARPAIGAGRRLVGQQQIDLEVDVRDAVRPGQHLRRCCAPR